MTPVRRKSAAEITTKDAVFDSAAALFANRGFDGVSVDDIARDAGVNKAMIYYHFADKLALYRSVLAEGLSEMGMTVSAIASSTDLPAAKLDRFIEGFVRMTETRPWMPALMLREIAEGAPRFDTHTMSHMRVVIASFTTILAQGQASGAFRHLHPILAYESVIGPIIINAARERVAEKPERKGADFPMLIAISHDDVIAHGQDTARRMLAP